MNFERRRRDTLTRTSVIVFGEQGQGVEVFRFPSLAGNMVDAQYIEPTEQYVEPVI